MNENSMYAVFWLCVAAVVCFGIQSCENHTRFEKEAAIAHEKTQQMLLEVRNVEKVEVK